MVQFSRMLKKIGAKIAVAFLYSSKIRGRNWGASPPPLRSANKSLPTSGGDAKSLVCQTRVHTHTRPAYWFPFEHVSRSSKQAGKHARLCAAKNLEDDFPAGILIVITPFHLRSIHRWEKRERKKRERERKGRGIEGLDIGYWNRRDSWHKTEGVDRREIGIMNESAASLPLSLNAPTTPFTLRRETLLKVYALRSSLPLMSIYDPRFFDSCLYRWMNFLVPLAPSTARRVSKYRLSKFVKVF